MHEHELIKKEILDKIEKYEKIAIFRHINPDFDALGAAYALQIFIKDNFKDKEIKILGDSYLLNQKLFPKYNKTGNNWFEKKFLAIVLDTPNQCRISDPRWKKADFIIKIDHHIFVEKIGELEYINEQSSSTCELLADLFFYFKLKISKECAKYLYVGIVGDSGRFEYPNTTPNTFAIARQLLLLGINLNQIYQDMYMHDQKELKIMAHILNNFKISKHGVAYYILYRKDLKKFNISTSEGKKHINLFRFNKQINIWCSISEDLKDDFFRVSIRSYEINVHEVAVKWQGGGHFNACGAKLTNINELDNFIKDLDQLIIKNVHTTSH